MTNDMSRGTYHLDGAIFEEGSALQITKKRWSFDWVVECQLVWLGDS